MKETNEKVYRCDYCNRAIVSKGSMKVHEKNCKFNPNNKHKCFDYCIHLEKTHEIINNGDEYANSITVFKCKNKDCNLFNKKLYSYKLERFKRNINRLSSMYRMPLQCEWFDELTY